ncbi:MAG: bifunctional riboflavin kinase/FAD synthetase [Anaerolineae bacterium]
MQIFRTLAQAHSTRPTVLTIGTFDGLHRGHQDIMRQLKTAAASLGAQTAVIAFHPRPKAVFAPDRFGSDYLTTAEERIALFEQYGVDVLLLVPFTLEFAQTTAFDFMRDMSQRLNLVQICVGHDFALGKDREGTIARLTELGRQFGFSVCEIQPFKLDGQVVSSTRIREFLQQGQVRQATRLLGRYPSLSSQVVQGAKRGRTIGFPTANLAVPPERLLPANGVYATFITLHQTGRRLPCVTNVGIRPSFNGTERTVETFIFDFGGDIYGQPVTLEFVERLRPEMKFDGIAALVAQINRDAARARELLSAEATP